MTKNSPPFLKNNPVDIEISTLVGLETYKALYAKWPNLYNYISDPLNPTFYYSNLVDGVVASSGLDYEICGQTIYNTLASLASIRMQGFGESLVSIRMQGFGESLVSKDAGNSDKTVGPRDIDSINLNLVSPLLQSSYKVDNLNDTFWGTAIWVIIVTFLAFYILIYLYIIGFWNFLFGSDGIACYDCKSIFDNLIF